MHFFIKEKFKVN